MNNILKHTLQRRALSRVIPVANSPLKPLVGVARSLRK
jgi:hypothetical protein